MSKLTTDEVLDLIESNGGPHDLDLKGQDLSGIDLGRDTILAKLKERGYTDREPAEVVKAGEGGEVRWGRLEERGYFQKAPPPWFSTLTGGIDLSGAQLQHAHLWRAQLQNADLAWAQLQNTNLRLVQLQNADLAWAQLQNTNLRFAQLQNARLFDARLQNADLSGAHLQGAFLYRAEIEAAHLEDVLWGGDYILGEEKAGDFRGGEAVYRRLKQWYSRSGQYHHAGELHFREMECRRKEAQGRVRSLWGLGSLRRKGGLGDWKARLKRAAEAAGLLLFGLSSGYGERPINTLVGLLAWWLLPALAYAVFTPLTWWNGLYHSAAFLVPFGEDAGVKGLPWAWADLALAQAYAGYFLMALFLVVLVLKMGHR